jgi:hypothetical protein
VGAGHVRLLLLHGASLLEGVLEPPDLEQEFAEIGLRDVGVERIQLRRAEQEPLALEAWAGSVARYLLA